MTEEEMQKIRLAGFKQKNTKFAENLRPTIAYYPDEVFAVIPEYANYAIGNFGTVYDFKTQSKLPGYLGTGNVPTVTLWNNITRRWKSFPRKKLVLMAFDPRPDQNKLQANRTDNNLYSSVYWPGHPLHNLAWSEPHMRIAPTVYGREFAEDACRILGQNGNAMAISQQLQVPYDAALKAFVAAIKARKSFKDLAEKYHVPYPKKMDKFTESDIIKICDIIMEGYEAIEVSNLAMQRFGISVKPSFIQSLKCNALPQWRYITERYDFPALLQRFDLTDEQVEFACERYRHAASPSEIQNALGLKCVPTSFVSFLDKLSKNEVERYQHISRKYFTFAEDEQFVSLDDEEE